MISDEDKKLVTDLRASLKMCQENWRVKMTEMRLVDLETILNMAEAHILYDSYQR